MLRLQTALPDRYTTADPDQLARWIGAAKADLGSRVIILGHHYQRDEVMAWADARGDSFGLSRIAADQTEAEFVVFCGVHFMAESADILTGPHQQVILPDLNAGCSMADMADIDSVEEAWDTLAAVTDIDRVVPVTYMNSSAALKAFVGRHGGVVCTSSNARAVLSWALGPDDTGPQPWRPGPLLPRPAPGPEHRLRARLRRRRHGRVEPASRPGRAGRRHAQDGHPAAVEGPLLGPPALPPAHIDAFRAEHPDGIVVVHPECSHEVVEAADQVGSTDYIIRAVADAPAGSVIGVGTEIHLVKRLDDETPDKTVVSLDPLVCPCSTMFRIDAAHLAWVLEGLVDGEVRNRITVDEETASWARVALERMLATV